MDIHVFMDISLNYPCFYGYLFGYPWISMDIYALTCYGSSIQGKENSPSPNWEIFFPFLFLISYTQQTLMVAFPIILYPVWKKKQNLFSFYPFYETLCDFFYCVSQVTSLKTGSRQEEVGNARALVIPLSCRATKHSDVKPLARHLV